MEFSINLLHQHLSRLMNFSMETQKQSTSNSYRNVDPQNPPLDIDRRVYIQSYRSNGNYCTEFGLPHDIRKIIPNANERRFFSILLQSITLLYHCS